MTFVKNYDALNTSPERKVILDLIEVALESIQPSHAIEKNFNLQGNLLKIADQEFDLNNFNRVFLIGFGKGSAGISKIVEEKLGEKLTEGHVIDLPANATHQALQAGTNPETFQKVHFTQGTHPLPSTINAAFTQALLKRVATLQLTEQDLVLVVICGGGSAMLVAPRDMSLDQKIDVNKALLKSGATISEMNVVRKHLSEVKGGGLAKALFPAIVASLIFSDVPGNDITVIASAPTVLDPTTIDDAKEILSRFNLNETLPYALEKLQETPKDESIFKNVHNIIVLSNETALEAMQKKAGELEIEARIFSNKFEGNAPDAGVQLIQETTPNSILLAGGETTVHVEGEGGKGGRNQEVVLGTLQDIDDKTIICSLASDGWDNTEFAGALGDSTVKNKASELSLNIPDFTSSHDSFHFFEQVGAGIETGRLPSNVSDLFIVYKY